MMSGSDQAGGWVSPFSQFNMVQGSNSTMSSRSQLGSGIAGSIAPKAIRRTLDKIRTASHCLARINKHPYRMSGPQTVGGCHHIYVVVVESR